MIKYVLCGYGDEKEPMAASTDRMVSDVKNLEKLLLKL